MKKIFIAIFLIFLSSNTVFAATDKYSQEYLQNKSHFSPTKPLVECIAKNALKSALKKETGANFDVKFEGYTVSSIKKGIFKSVEVTGNDISINDIPVTYINLKSITDYNYIDYTQNPIVFKSDMIFAYDMLITDETMNKALQNANYNKTIDKVNKMAGKFFVINTVRTKIVNNKLYLIVDYNFPFKKLSKDRSFVVSTDLIVINGQIKATNVHVDSIYGNLGLDKVANLINLLNPLEFTLDMLDNNEYKGNIENINIVDNKLKVDGKIYLKGKV